MPIPRVYATPAVAANVRVYIAIVVWHYVVTLAWAFAFRQ